MRSEPLAGSAFAPLVAAARAAAEKAYCPYSGFRVGAALRGLDGTVYTGCNVENVAYGPSNCAERTAVFKAISEGAREFDAVAIVGWGEGQSPADAAFCMPCGTCRQVLAEFCAPDKLQVVVESAGEVQVYTLAELLPEAFLPDLKK